MTHTCLPPQDVACPYRHAERVITANISSIAAYMTPEFFAEYGLKPTQLQHLHASATSTEGARNGNGHEEADLVDVPTKENMRVLCDLTLPEYTALGLPQPGVCSAAA